MLTVAALVFSAGEAGAAPQPSLSQVKHKLAMLKSQEDQAVQQYDQAAQTLADARQRLALVNRQVSRDRVQFQVARTQIAQMAAVAYENGNLTSFGALLTNPNPQAVIGQASILQHLSSDRAAELNSLIAAARQYAMAQQTASRTEVAVTALEKQRLARKNTITAAVSRQQALLAQLTAQQQAAIFAGATTTGIYTGPTNTQAEEAVAVAYDQLG
jgi:septal ring factor EnvC (AmiA/AmiB activator)